MILSVIKLGRTPRSPGRVCNFISQSQPPLARLLSVGSASDEGVLILHDEPSATSLQHNECSDMSLILVSNFVRRNVCAHLAGYGHHRHIVRSEANIHLFHNVSDTFEKSTMHFLQFL